MDANIVDVLLTNLTHVGIGLSIFLFAYLSNMCFGIWQNTKILGEPFDWNKILNSFVKIICVGAGIVLLVMAVTFIVPFANVIGLKIPEEYESVVNIIATISTCLYASLRYIKEAWDKMGCIFNGKKAGGKEKLKDE